MNKEDLEEMEDIMLSYLVFSYLGDLVFYVHITYEENEEDIDELGAYTDLLDKCAGLYQFEISYDPVIKEDPPLFKRVIAHELVHVMQILRGDIFDYTLLYHEQPHEIEAYSLEEEVVSYYELIKEQEWKK